MKLTLLTPGVPVHIGCVGLVRLAQDPLSQYRGIVVAVGERGKWITEGDYAGALAVSVEFHSDMWRCLYADRGDQFEAATDLIPGEIGKWAHLSGKFTRALSELHGMTPDDYAAWRDAQMAKGATP